MSEQAEFRLQSGDQPGAFLPGWPKTSILPQKHTGYAYQWFALSFALVLLTLIATVKLKQDDSDK